MALPRRLGALALIAGLAAISGWLPAIAAVPLAGRPAIQRFSPDLEIYPSAFAVAQDIHGLVYVATADGLAAFDGDRWTLHPMPNDDLVRSLAHDGAGRLYIGGYDAFGYIETPAAPDAKPVLISTMVDDADASFDDVWHVLVAPEGVFFLALNHLFRYDPDTEALDTWRHDGRFGAIARIDGRVVVQYRGEGLRVFEAGDFVVLPETETLDEQLFELIPLTSGGALTLARDGRWQRAGINGVEDLVVPDVLPASSEFNAATPTPGGRIAMGTRDGHVWFLDPEAGTAESVRVSTDWISDLIPSLEGGLIVQTDHETLHLRWPSKWTALGPESGLTGMIHELVEWQGRWVAVSNGGVLARPRPGEAFEPIGWTDFEAWDLHPLEDGTGLLAESYVLKHVGPAGVLASFEAIQYPRTVLSSRFDDDLFYVGTDFGVATLRRDRNGRFHVVREPEDGSDPVLTLVETAPGELLVGSDPGGVTLLRFDAERREIVERRGFDDILTYDRFTSSEVMSTSRGVLAVTMGGVWRFVDGEFVRLELEGLDALRDPDAFLSLAEAPDGTLWAWDFKRLFRNTGQGRWQPMELAPLLRGAIGSVGFDDSGRLLAGMLGGVLIHDPDAQESFNPGLEVLMRGVEYRPAGEPPRSLALDRVHELRPGERYSLRFDYALPGLDGRDKVLYQARLSGFEDAFSDWDPAHHFTYYNLRPGRYAFEARARDSLGRITRIDPFEFEIVPPWTESASMRGLRWILVGIALIALVWLLMRARVWRLEAERRRLSAMVVERTEALEAANRQLKQIAEVDELTGVANRRRLDAHLRRHLDPGRRQQRPLALALIDLDRFKPFNDRHGHLAGDRALRRVADCLRGVFDGEDHLVARFGGDEFVAVMPDTDREAAVAKAQQARSALERCEVDLKFSIGIALVGIGARVEPEALLAAADEQMYVSKKAGRDGVSVSVVEPGPS